MIIETPYKNGDTISLKLASGEEIVARLVEENNNNIVVKKPMVLIMQQESLGLAPFMFSVDPQGKFTINASTVNCIAKTQTEIAKQYTAQTSGLAL